MPTGKQPIGSYLTQDLPTDIASSRQDPAYFQKAVQEHRLFLPHKTMQATDPEEIVGAGQAYMIKNMNEIYKRLSPEARERSQLWYPGGRQLSESLGRETGTNPEAAAGAFAALSPQADWFVNIDRAQRVGRAFAADPVISPQTLDAFKKNASSGLTSYANELKPYLGKRISEMPDREAALGVMAHDYAIDPTRTYNAYAPEGNVLDVVRAPKSGQPMRSAFKDVISVQKALKSFRSGGDPEVISKEVVGKGNKVRNFYNDIIAPDADPIVGKQTFADVTVDTHQGGALTMRPVSSDDLIPQTFLGLAGPGSAALGTSGLYPFGAEATRTLAQQYGVGPSQMQSPIWEGVRSLFPAAWKTKGNKAKVNAVWDEFQHGKISQDEALNRIFKLTPHDVNVNIPWLRGR